MSTANKQQASPGQLTIFRQELANTPGTADKASVIKNYTEGTTWIAEAIQYCYDPFMQYYIKKLPVVNQTGSKTLDQVEWEQTVRPVLNDLHNRRYEYIKDRNTAITNLLSQYTAEDQDTLQKILLKDLRVNVGAKGFNNAVGYDLIPIPDTQLCKTYDPDKRIKNVKAWWATPKLNGLRGRYMKRHASFIQESSYKLVTREDYILWGFSELQKELNDFAEIGQYNMVDGEIFSFEIPFQTIMSIAREEKNYDPVTKSKLKMYIFNVQQDKPWDSTESMINHMNETFQKAMLERGKPFQYIEVLEYKTINNDPVAIRQECIRYMLSGYEGIVLRDPVISWEAGARNNHLLKYKLFCETDLRVIGVKYGASGKKWEHQIAALLCEGKVTAIRRQLGENTYIYVPVSGSNTDYIDSLGAGEKIFEVYVQVEASLSSLTDAERLEMTQNAGSIVGKTAEVKFQAITDTPNSDGVYSLQFPVFLKFKD